jgi:leucyl/phenylalanyl-tRNA--protein transferase
MLLWSSCKVSDNPWHILWHYAHGRMPDWINGGSGEVAWIKRKHRGIQWLDKIQLPKKSQHLKYILQPKFTIKFNTAFEQVVRACADLKREGKTWITEELFRGYGALHKLGFAHSFEAWDGEKLVAGAFGLQMGSIMSIDSVFHHVSNAGMAVYGQTLLRLKDRGFKLVDVNYVSGPFARFGEEWVPQWKFEELLAGMMKEQLTVADGMTSPLLPRGMATMLPFSRGIEKLMGKIRSPYVEAPAAPTTAAAGEEKGDAVAPATEGKIDPASGEPARLAG